MPENNDAADSRFGQSPPAGDDSLRLDEDCPVAGAKRRTVLKATLGAGLSLGLGAAPLTELAAATAKSPKCMRATYSVCSTPGRMPFPWLPTTTPVSAPPKC